MAVWLVRAGKYGEREGFALERKVATIGWSLIPDLTLYDSRQAVRAILEERYPSEAAGTIANWTGQLWRFATEIAPGDVVAIEVLVGHPRLCGDASQRSHTSNSPTPETSSLIGRRFNGDRPAPTADAQTLQ
jgi:predicted Mrr-cat superfamily restriction endonuclease